LRIEEAIKLAKSPAGTADYEVHHFHSLYQHIPLSQLAAVFLAARAAIEPGGGQDTEPHARAPEWPHQSPPARPDRGDRFQGRPPPGPDGPSTTTPGADPSRPAVVALASPSPGRHPGPPPQM